ncbi:MAG: hypothetical protein ACKVT2_17220 [Saprospiraceae bacterium]
MTASHIPAPKDIIALLAQNGVYSTDKEAFVKAFKVLYPTLSATQRTELIADLLAYVDTVLEPERLPKSA